ncbi:DUF3800 domain-containing protein [Aestuariivirga sp.]|uniref:DUF3800 domain-containing protein n=1 Tax=Aestuariivirga sp. TaxID=2650926 RepID=UPI0035B12477
MANPNENPEYEYVAYIDESGDPGIERVKPIDPNGASEWLVLSAAVIQKKRELECVEWVKNMIQRLNVRQRSDLHYRSLSPSKKLVACNALGKFPIRLFVLASNKKNMRGHKNERAARTSGPIKPSQYMYNFCARLLLERVTEFVEAKSIANFGKPQKLKIVFSERGGLTYGQTAAYTELLKNQSRAGTTFLDVRQVKWSVLDRRLILPAAHGKIAGLQMADIVASAFYQAVDILEVENDPQYAAELIPRLWQCDGRIANHGLSLQPHPKKANLLPAQKAIFEMCGYRF